MNSPTDAIEKIQERGCGLLAQAEVVAQQEAAGEGSSTALELGMIQAEMEFLASLGRSLVCHKT